jgi:hypothetical protein
MSRATWCIHGAHGVHGTYIAKSNVRHSRLAKSSHQRADRWAAFEIVAQHLLSRGRAPAQPRSGIAVQI